MNPLGEYRYMARKSSPWLERGRPLAPCSQFHQQNKCKTTGTKAAYEMLVKLTLVVNFSYILQATFSPILFSQKITTPNYN